MKLSRTLIAIAGIILFLTSCDQDSVQDSIAVKANTNPLLAYVPADIAVNKSMIVAALLEPIPKLIMVRPSALVAACIARSAP